MNVKNQHSWKWLGFWVMALELCQLLQYLSMYFTFFKFLYRLNYMALQGWNRYYVMHNLKLVIPWFGWGSTKGGPSNSTQLSLRATAPQTQPI